MGPKVIGYINKNLNYDFNYQGYDFFADEITLKAPYIIMAYIVMACIV